ncbi:ATP-dependent nuclease [Nocardioides sp. Soil777]|uniref:ATP-dependent nuclease n=1 Tax=Nocardioides sp. Soil777 TaxID=1736409 RepID=UPI00138EE258|nr:ATP-binding protein [Nocardioides sp. Soil777]
MLRRLSISNFRGIKSCDWSIDQRLVAMVGPGDSAKTTLLDAIGLVLSPNYSPQFTDADFFNLDMSEPLTIEAVVTELPDSLVKESQLGKERSGLKSDGTLVHDPLDDAEECLVIRLTVTRELEPTWEVVRPGSDETRGITASQRRQLGFFRLGERPDFHLRWARGSALSGLTEGSDGASSVILDAQREARRAVFDAEPNPLHAAAGAAQSSATKLGISPFTKLRPGLEPGSAASAHALMLHDGEVPLSSFGLGTRRLTSLSVQDQAMAGGSIIGIDELEHGLEPHRLAHVLRYLKKRAGDQHLQVILTTHSPITVETLEVQHLAVIRTDGGTTSCRAVPDHLENAQGAFRSAPSALLGRRVIVGEGATEVGFLRGLILHWDEQRLAAELSLVSAIGTVIVNGSGGTQPTQRARNFQSLGYPSLLLMDNDDRAVDDEVSSAVADGVVAERWSYGRALEDEVVQSLTIEGLQALVDLATELRGEESIRASVGAKLGDAQLTGTDFAQWQTEAGVDESGLRDAVAAAAKGTKSKGNAWFKREDAGESLAAVVMKDSANLDGTALMDIIGRIQEFAYYEAPVPDAAAEQRTAETAETADA